jgi:hypothetical protein
LPAAFLSAGAVVFAAVLIGAMYSRRPPGHFTRDPLCVAEEPFYIGILSNFSVLGWAAGATVALFAAVALRGAGSARRQGAFLGGFGAFTALLTLDDLFMLHDQAFPDYLGVPEPFVLGAYVAIAVALLIAFASQIASTRVTLLALALALFAGSLICDALYDDEGWAPFYEEGFKFFGIAAWASWLMVTGLQWLSDAHSPRRIAAEPPGA